MNLALNLVLVFYDHLKRANAIQTGQTRDQMFPTLCFYVSTICAEYVVWLDCYFNYYSVTLCAVSIESNMNRPSEKTFQTNALRNWILVLVSLHHLFFTSIKPYFLSWLILPLHFLIEYCASNFLIIMTIIIAYNVYYYIVWPILYQNICAK